MRAPSVAKPRVASIAATSAHVRDLERRFEEVLGTKVTILSRPGKSSGRIVIEYYSVDDFERIGASKWIPCCYNASADQRYRTFTHAAPGGAAGR